MPLPVNNLNPNSSQDEIDQAISDTISKLIREGKTKEEAAAEAFSIARKLTGKRMQPVA